MPGTARRRALRLRTQLALLLALVLTGSAVQVAFFVGANATSFRAHEEALAWSHHAVLVKEVEAATATYLRDLEDRAVRGPSVDVDASRARLVEAARESSRAAASFSEEELAEERELGKALDHLLRLGDAGVSEGGTQGAETARLHFEAAVHPLLARRAQGEESGARNAAARGTAAARRALYLAAGAGLLLLGASAYFVLRLARRIHRGLAGLEESARAIAGGQLGATAPTDDDELGAVGAAFNAMSTRLQETTVSRSELSRLVHERTLELERSTEELQRNLRELRETQTQLAASGRLAAVGTLAAGVAFELNNPLSFVVANTGFARDQLQELAEQLDAGRMPSGAQVAELREALDEARQGAHRVREIVRDLRTFARGDEEKREPQDVGAVLEAALRMASADLRRVGRVVRELRQLPPADASGGRLAQVFLTLLTNAAGAMPDRNPSENEIRIGGETRGTELAISFSDNGLPIPEADLERIFEPYARASGPGSGLGLAVCRRLVQQLGGTITARSDPGEGNTFCVTLPVAAPRVEGSPRLVSPTRIGPHGRLLVVDDEALVIATLERILSGHQVEGVADGRAALTLLRQGRAYDVILIDLVMAGMSGMELYAELERSFPQLVPCVLIVTGASFSPGVREFLERVPNPRLEKPFDPEVLRRLVQQLVEQSRGQLGTARPPADASRPTERS